MYFSELIFYKPITLEYSIDRGESWTEFNTSSLTRNKTSLSITIPANTTMYLRGNNEGFGYYSFYYEYQGTKIYCTKRHNIGGNLVSLLSKDLVEPETFPNYCFSCLFSSDTKLIDASKLIMLSKTGEHCYSDMFSGCTSLTTAPKLPATTLADDCYSSMFSGCTNLTTAPKLLATTLASNCYSSMFSRCTNLTTAPKLLATTLASNCYSSMFSGCISLTTAPELPATTLASNCYSSMFTGCISLTTAPELPATTLADHCYYYMFQNCTSLTTAPELPATTLADHCYFGMFQGCTSLTAAPELPATTLAGSCYAAMFKDCTSLTTASELRATTLASSCYSSMFSGCTSLTIAPELPATTLASYCYYNMFQGCTGLTIAPELPAITLAYHCYDEMFKGCTSLTTAPELPATALEYSCYFRMFQGCTSLATAPELPATTLTDYCYSGMFSGCTSLTTAPELPATTLTDNCYSNMFNGCTNLNYVKALFTSKQSTSLTDWLSGTASSGKFVKKYKANWTSSNINLPSGWTIVNDKDNYTITVNYKTINGDILHTEIISDKFLNAPTFTPNATIDGYIYDNLELEILDDGQIDILIYPSVTYAVTRKYQDEEGNTLKENDIISYTVGIGGMNEVVIEPSIESIDFNGDTYRFVKIQTVLMDNIEVIFVGSEYSFSWSGNWTIDKSSYSYPCYRSNTISHNKSTVQRLTFKGVNEIVIKMVYKGQNTRDYLTYGNIDASCSRTNCLGTLYGTYGTWKTVTYTPTNNGEHYIEFCYSKDNSGSEAPDCAWVYIESINGKEINGVVNGKEINGVIKENYIVTVNYKTIDGDILHTEIISGKFINASTFTPNATIDGYIYDNLELEILDDGQIFNILIYPSVTYTVTRKYQDEERNTLKEDDTISYTVGIGGMNEVDIEPSVESIDFNGDTYRFEKIQTVLTDNIEVIFIGYQTTFSWSGNWTLDGSTYSYSCYRSNTINHKESTVQRLTFKGVSEIVIKMIYEGENNYDYLTYGNIDESCSRSKFLGSLKGTSGTWKTVTFTPTDNGEHFIEFCYSKDNSGSEAPDCAWVYIESINGIPFDVYNSDVYDDSGYDRDGYNKDGYNRYGYDRDGYDIYGYDRDGYDHSGYYRDGYNRSGYDRDGYDREGYDRDGYNRSGYDRDGYGKDGYNKSGYYHNNSSGSNYSSGSGF